MMDLKVDMANKNDFINFEIVVARYNEDVDWTYEFENVCIYDKSNTNNLKEYGFKGLYVSGKKELWIVKVKNDLKNEMVDEIDIESGEGGKVIKEYKHINDFNQATKAFNRFIKYKPKIISLPNLGRESQTYLYHIIKKYDYYNFECGGGRFGRNEGAVVFLQGNPFDHSPNIIKNLHMYKKDYKELLNERKTSRNFETKDGGEFAYLGETLHVTNILNPRDHRNIKWPLRQIYSELFNCPEKDIPNTDLEFYNGAQFIVSINTILSNDIEFYKKMIKHVSKDVRPKAGFVMERLWSLVFKADKL